MGLDVPGNVIDIVLAEYQKERFIEEGNKNLEAIKGRQQRLKALPKINAINIEAIASMNEGLIRPSVRQIPAIAVPQIMSDVEFAAWEVEMDRQIEETQRLIDELEENWIGKVNSESDSNENSFEIFVAEAAEQADPVYEVNGIRIWIQPLPADIYHLDHDMTLNDFLDLIGILNDPTKQAIYINRLSGATYILNIFDGNMPLVDVLDLIGYDRNNLEQQFLGNAHRIQVIDTTTILQLQDDTTALFHPDVSEEIFYRHGITDYQRSYFSKKVLDTFDIVKLRFQDTFRETIYESAYNIIKTRYSEDFGITQEEWLELVDSKAKDEHGAFTQEFEKIVDLCLKEQVFLNLIELSGAQDQDGDAIFSTLDAFLDENFGLLIEQLFAPLTFEAFIDEVIDQVLNNIDNEGFVTFDVATHEYFEDLISVQDSYKAELVSVYWGSPPPPEFKSRKLIESEFNGELDVLSMLFYRIREYLIDQNIRDLPITDTLLGLHGPGDPSTYTTQYLTNVLKDLGLNDEKKLQDMLLNQKAFYKTLLEKIQYDIQNNPNSAFKAYSNTLSGEIESGKYLTEQELELVKRLDDVLNEVLGYVGYTLLKLGFITFDGNEQIEFQMPQDLTTLAKIIRVLGLDSIAELKTSYFSIMEYLETLIWSMILSGHYMNLKTLDNNGQVELRKAYTYPGNHFLPGIYKNFMGNIPDSIYHLSMIWNFMNLQNMQDRLNLLGINPELEGNAYRLDGRREGEYGTNKLKLLVYDKDLTFEELDIKFRQKFDMNEDLDSNIAIFDRLRQQEGWTTRFGYRSGNVAFVKFRLKFQDGSIKTGYIFAHSGIQVMPGIEIRDGKYYINPDHWANEIYPAFEVNGKPRDSDAERKIILALLDKFDMTNLVEGELALYSERPICPSCALILSNFELGFSYLENNFQFEINENVRNLPLED